MTYNDIRLTSSAYFFRKSSGIPDSIVERFFAKISERRSEDPLLYVLRETKDQVVFSLIIFPFERIPSFLEESVAISDGIFEKSYAYLVLAEYDSFVVINSRNINGQPIISEYLEHLDYNILVKLYHSDNTLFEKFTLQNTDISDRALRTKRMEAIDLKEIIGALGANKFIVNNLRVGVDYNKISLNTGTSRINQLGEKYTIDDFLNWSVVVVDQINNLDISQPSYTDIFATPLKFSDHIKGLLPISILFSFGRVIEEIERNEIIEIYYQLGKEKRVINDFIKKLKAFEKALPISQIIKRGFTVHKIEIDAIKDFVMLINDKSITVHSKRLRNVMIKRRGADDISLLEHINRTNAFFVVFEEAEFVYYARHLFKDNQLLGNIEGFLSIFKPLITINDSIGEKGKITALQKKFQPKSLFRIIEDTFSKEFKFLVCDDLGKEWADFIGIGEERIVFFHAKTGKTGISATNFHEVIGQAQKNLGNMSPSINDLEKKKRIWSDTYRDDKINSQILRLRKGSNVEDLILEYQKVMRRPNLKRQVIVFIDFISYASLSQNLYLLRDGKPCKSKREMVQILWFISSLIATCREVGVEVFIYCKP